MKKVLIESVFSMSVKELRLRHKMILAVYPLYKAGVWSKDQFDEYCFNVLSSKRNEETVCA